MDFKINPLSFTGIFPVPNQLVDENIRLASVVQLKVMLYLLRHANDSGLCVQKICDALFYDREDVTDALIFWQERGLVIKDGQTPVSDSPTAEKAEPVTTVRLQKAEIETKPSVTEAASSQEKKALPSLDIPRPSHEQVAARVQECQELATLFQEAQVILGKTVGYEGQAVLIMMYDGYGLPIEVILMAIQYAVDKKKSGYSQIAKIGKLWCENEIFTIEAVSEFIESHSIVDETWDKLRSMTEITNRNPTEKQRRYITAWVKEFGYSADMIYYAYEESIDRTGKMSMPYMDKVIRNWHSAGVKTPTDIQNLQKEWEQRREKQTVPQTKGKAKSTPGNSRAASYDMDKFMQKAVNVRQFKIQND